MVLIMWLTKHKLRNTLFICVRDQILLLLLRPVLGAETSRHELICMKLKPSIIASLLGGN